MMGFSKCKLMRRLHLSGEWAEFQGFVTLTIQNGIGLTFRDAETSSILCDVPKAAISSIELVKASRMFKVELKNGSSDILSCVAFQVPGEEIVSIDDCVTILQDNDFHLNKIASLVFKGENSMGLFPDITNAETQQLVLQLLLRQDFHEYVEQLGEFLNEFQTNL